MENNGSQEQQADHASDIPAIQSISTPAEDVAGQSTVPQRPPPGVALCDLNLVVQKLLEWMASGEADSGNEDTDSESFCLYDIEIDSSATFSDSEMDFEIEDASTNDLVMDTAAPGTGDSEDRDMFLEMATLLVDIKRPRSACSQSAARGVAHPVDRRGLDQDARASSSQLEVPGDMSPLELLAYVSVNMAIKI